MCRALGTDASVAGAVNLHTPSHDRGRAGTLPRLSMDPAPTLGSTARLLGSKCWQRAAPDRGTEQKSAPIGVF
ncbi:hypothetical protein GCM10010232_17110 [Streptomyces amakusaensis]